MTSNRPYLIRALYDWIVDNAHTPHILVDGEFPGVDVPPGTIKDGKVVLNISPEAVQGLVLDNEWISFQARFSGKEFPVAVPVAAVQGIFARENGQGMLFNEESGDPPDKPEERPKGKPTLRVVR